MKTRIFLAQFLLLTMCGAVVLADDKAESKKNLVKEYIEKFGGPGPEHKLLEPLVGHYHAKVRCWMDPTQAPQVSEGKLVRKAIFDGRFVEERFEGQLMERPFHGIGFLGYDRAQKKFVSTWLDSISTAMMHSNGTYDESSKTWTFKHEGTCPITSKPLRTRETLHIVSNNEQQLEMYKQLGDEKESKTMEIVLTRQQKASGQ